MINNFALIIGSMKCGTTSLFRYLSEHPQISPCKQKEPNFFASDLNWEKGFDWYQKLWDFDPTKHLIALEGSTHYTKIPKFPNAAQRISTVKANFKFIFIMRNPLDRIESHYTHGFQANWQSIKQPIEDIENNHALEVSQYAMQIDEYYKKFSPDNILLLNFEDLKLDPSSLLRRVCLFLGIDDSFPFSNIRSVSNTSKGKIIDSPMWSSIKPIVQYFPWRFQQAIRRSIGKEVGEKIKLSDHQRDLVLKELHDDLCKLKRDYDVDISRWGIKV